MLGKKIRILVLAGGLLLLKGPGPAQAFVFHDGPAFAQRAAQLLIYLKQYRQLIENGGQALSAFRSAYEGLKDWKNLGWLDTLDLVNMPWFDGVEGIDDIRKSVFMTVMTTDQVMALWGDVDQFGQWKKNPRYLTDPWYRRKVDSLFRQSTRAKKQRAALIRQMQSQNKALIDDTTKIKRLRDAIEAANKEKPVNQAKVTSLQAEMTAVHAKYQGQDLMLRNQQAIMFLVGEDEAQRAYLEVTDRGWMKTNSEGMREFGRGFGR